MAEGFDTGQSERMSDNARYWFDALYQSFGISNGSEVAQRIIFSLLKKELRAHAPQEPLTEAEEERLLQNMVSSICRLIYKGKHVRTEGYPKELATALDAMYEKEGETLIKRYVARFLEEFREGKSLNTITGLTVDAAYSKDREEQSRYEQLHSRIANIALTAVSEWSELRKENDTSNLETEAYLDSIVTMILSKEARATRHEQLKFTKTGSFIIDVCFLRGADGRLSYAALLPAYRKLADAIADKLSTSLLPTADLDRVDFGPDKALLMLFMWYKEKFPERVPALTAYFDKHPMSEAKKIFESV